MKFHKTGPRPERLRELFVYDAETGYLIRKTDTYNKSHGCAGDRAGYESKGRRFIGIDDVKYLESRVIMALHLGRRLRAHEVVDHINHNAADNRLANLRVCSQAENIRNVRRKKSNTSGYIGVHRRVCNGRFLAYFRTATGRRRYLGHFDTAEEAAKARDAATKKAHGAFAVLNFPETA